MDRNYYLIEIEYSWADKPNNCHLAYFFADSTLHNHWNFKLMDFVGTPPDKPIWYRVGEPGGDFLECRQIYVDNATVTKINLGEK